MDDTEEVSEFDEAVMRNEKICVSPESIHAKSYKGVLAGKRMW